MIKEFKNKKIIFLVSTQWGDGTSYKFVKFFETKYGIESITNSSILMRNKIDLGICLGDRISPYRNFLRKGIPYLLVEHDILSLRYAKKEENHQHDREKMENACAAIFTSEDHAEYYENLSKRFGWDLPEYIVVHNRPLRKDTQFDEKKKLKNLNLVYAGGLLNKRLNSSYSYRTYLSIFRKFIEAGWNVHLYPTKFGRKDILRSYGEIGCILHNWIPGNKIYQEMSQYTAGFHGYNKTDVPERAYQYTQLCRANKIYDYLASGIPTIGYQGGNGMEIYRDKWGIVIDDLEPETLKAIPERLKKIKILKKWRKDNVLEKEKDKFKHIINVALEEAENKDRKRYYITGDRKVKEPEPYKPFRNQNGEPFPKMIIVTNKGPREIARGNRVFEGHKTSEPLTVNKREWKEIKAHVGLLIKHMD